MDFFCKPQEKKKSFSHNWFIWVAVYFLEEIYLETKGGFEITLSWYSLLCRQMARYGLDKWYFPPVLAFFCSVLFPLFFPLLFFLPCLFIMLGPLEKGCY